MKIISISGKAQSGKDTTAALLKEVLETDGYTVLIAHYADLLKYICKTFFGWNGVKDEAGRQMLQYIGTDVVRKQNPDYWVNFLLSVLNLFPHEWDYVLIPDSRFPNELDCIRQSDIDSVHLRIERPGLVSPLTPEQQNHPSETALDDVAADYHIVNDGALEDLRKKVIDLAVKMNGAHQTTLWEK